MSLNSTVSSNNRGHVELMLFAALVGAHLLPVWLFRYVPTGDGPSHVGNSIVLRDYFDPHARHREFFELALALFPNWTSHVVLAGLSCIVPPLCAEKLLVSGYVIGLAFACRGFLRCWTGSVALAPFCLLFVFTRAFFMGFYNFCLSLPLMFVILALCAPRPERPSAAWLLSLAALFVVTYFTHLVGFILAVLGALLLSTTAALCAGQRRDWLAPVAVFVAMLPALALLLEYFASSGLAVSSLAEMITRKSWSGVSSSAGLMSFAEAIANLNREIFAPYDAWTLPLDGWWLMYGAVAFGMLLERRGTAPTQPDAAPSRLPIMLLGLAFGLLYLTVPNNLGRHGGIVKMRLAMVLPLVWLACLRLPHRRGYAVPLRAGMLAMVVAQLTCTWAHFAAANRALDAYTAGIGEFGRGHVLYVFQRTAQGNDDYFAHAANYYCLDSATTNLDNYEAGTHYFPMTRCDARPQRALRAVSATSRSGPRAHLGHAQCHLAAGISCNLPGGTLDDRRTAVALERKCNDVRAMARARARDAVPGNSVPGTGAGAAHRFSRRAVPSRHAYLGTGRRSLLQEHGGGIADHVAERSQGSEGRWHVVSGSSAGRLRRDDERANPRGPGAEGGTRRWRAAGRQAVDARRAPVPCGRKRSGHWRSKRRRRHG